VKQINAKKIKIGREIFMICPNKKEKGLSSENFQGWKEKATEAPLEQVIKTPVDRALRNKDVCIGFFV
jgi:hypothetical protein